MSGSAVASYVYTATPTSDNPYISGATYTISPNPLTDNTYTFTGDNPFQSFATYIDTNQPYFGELAETGGQAFVTDISLAGTNQFLVYSNVELDTSVTYTLDTAAEFTPCFYPGTLIRTPLGESAVESLIAGDLVTLADGRTAPIFWLGRQTISTRFADPMRVLPIRIKAGALGENLPARDLLISPDHAILIDDVLVQAGALVNDTSIVRETDVPEVFTYYHVELATHELLLAEGAQAESFVDNVGRMAFQNWAEHEAIAGADSIYEMPYPRAKSCRQVPMHIRRMLADRAAPFEPAKAA
jgi:hypothetical protein